MKWTNLENLIAELCAEYESGTNKRIPNFWDLKLKWEYQFGDEYYVIEFEAPKYWYYAENGRGPGKRPPINAIENWIRKRKTVPNTHQLAFMIANRIASSGTISENKHWLKNTEDEIEITLIDRIGEAVSKDISNQVDEYFAEPF